MEEQKKYTIIIWSRDFDKPKSKIQNITSPDTVIVKRLQIGKQRGVFTYMFNTKLTYNEKYIY